MNLLRLLRPCVALSALALAAAACKSTGPESGTPDDGKLASVFIRNSSRPEIADTTVAVFQTNGFTVQSRTFTEIVFDRPGSSWQNLAYGGWFEGVWMRAKVDISIFDLERHRLACDAFRVEAHGDRTMEREKKVSRGQAKPLQLILEQIKHRIEGPPTATAK